MVAKRAEKRFPSAYKKYVAGGNNMISYTIKVNGMMCGHCVMHVEKAATSVDGVLSAKADLANKEVVIEHNGADINLIKQKIKDAGYEVK